MTINFFQATVNIIFNILAVVNINIKLENQFDAFN